MLIESVNDLNFQVSDTALHKIISFKKGDLRRQVIPKCLSKFINTDAPARNVLENARSQYIIDNDDDERQEQ